MIEKGNVYRPAGRNVDLARLIHNAHPPPLYTPSIPKLIKIRAISRVYVRVSTSKVSWVSGGSRRGASVAFGGCSTPVPGSNLKKP